MKKKMLQILMLFSAFFLTTNVFGQTDGFYLLNQGNNKYLQMVKAATDISGSNGNKNDGQLGFIGSKDASTTCWTFTQCSSTQLVKFANSGNDNVVYFGQPNSQNQDWSYKLCGFAKYNGTNSTATASNQSSAGAGSKYNCYLYKINNYTATGTSFTATLTTTAEVGGYYFIASANVNKNGSGLMLMGNTINEFTADNGSETQDVIAGTNISDKPNTETITVNVSNIINYIYKFEDAGSTPTPTPTSNTFYLINSEGKYLNASGTALDHSDTPIEWTVEQVNTTNYMNISPKGETNHLNYASGGSTYFKLNSSNSAISLYQIDDIEEQSWTATLVTTITSGKYYYIVRTSGTQYAMNNTFGRTNFNVNLKDNKCVYQFISPGSTPEPKPLTTNQYYIKGVNGSSTKYLSGTSTSLSLGNDKQVWTVTSNTDGIFTVKTKSGSTEYTLNLSNDKTRKFNLATTPKSDATPTCTIYKVTNNKTLNKVTGVNTTDKFALGFATSSGNTYPLPNTGTFTESTDGKIKSTGDQIELNTVSENYNYMFEIVPVTYYGQLTVEANDNNYGTVSVSPSKQGSTTVWEGSSESTMTAATQELTLTATQTGSCTFKGWSNDGGVTIIENSNVPSYTYKFNYNSTTQNNPTNVTLTAVFVPATYYGKLTVAANDANFGTVSVDPATSGTTVWSDSEETTAEKGSKELTIKAVPSTGYQFKEWQKGGVAISGATAEYNYTFEFTSTTQDTPTEETLTAVFEAIPVTGVSLNKTETTIEKNGTETLTATVTPNDALNKKVTWSSSNTSVATVNENGVVTAVDGGNAIITVTTEDGSKTATCTVTVTVPVTEVTLNMNETKVKVGETVTLIATVLPENATNQNVSWSSSDGSVAKVENGVVTAEAPGNATITVTTEDGSKTATCTVNVIESKESWDDIVVSTIPMSTEGGTAAAKATVIVGEKSYPAIKAGAEGTPGVVVIKVPAGITKVRVHLNGWQNETPEVSITTTSDSEEYTLKADNGVVGDENIFTLQNHPYDNCYTINLSQNVDVKSNGLRKSADDGQTEITIAATGQGGDRFVLYGVTGDEYTREVNTSDFVLGTICLPSYGEVKNYDGVQFFSILHKSDPQYDIIKGDFRTPRYVTLQKVEATDLVSGTPYIYKATKTFTVELPETNIAEQPVAATGLVGTFSEIKYLGQHNYIIYNNLLYVVNSNNVIIDPLRAYIDLEGVPTESQEPNPTPGVKMFNFFYNEADGIMNIYDNDNVNGNVNVNLNGQAVGAEYKGIVIMNGKKVLRR